LVKSDGVVYLRLDMSVAYVSGVFSFSLCGSISYRKGRVVTLLSTGGILRDVVEAVELLQKQGIDAGVLSMHSVKPIDKNVLSFSANCVNLSKKASRIVIL
jgi:transketolase